MQSIKKYFISCCMIIVFITSGLMTQFAFAQGTPVGSWQTYDLDGTARSIVKFSIHGNQLQGRIVKLISPAKGQTSNNKAHVGLVVIWGLTQNGSDWEGGQVMDTDTGKVYRCNVSVSDDNQTLHLHAYVAIPVLGKTVDWVRVSR